MWEVPATHLVELLSAVRAEQHSGENRHFTERSNAPAALTDKLDNIEVLTFDNGLVDVLKYYPLGQVIINGLIVLVGLCVY